MNKLPRLLIPIGLGLVTIVIGVFLGRALRSPEPPPPIAQADASAVAAGQLVLAGELPSTSNDTVDPAAVDGEEAGSGFEIVSVLTATEGGAFPGGVGPAGSPLDVDPSTIPVDPLLTGGSASLGVAAPSRLAAVPMASGPAAVDDVVEFLAEPIDVITGPPTTEPTTQPATDPTTEPATEPEAEAEPSESDDEGSVGAPGGEIGGAPEAPDAPEDADGAPLIDFVDFGVALDLPPIEFDPCAGPEPGAGLPIGCGDGVSGTLFAYSAPPPLTIASVEGHATEPRPTGGPICPASTPTAAAGQRPFTIWSSVPLPSVTLRYRPHGTEAAWEEISLSAPADQVEAWDRRFEVDEYSSTWGTVPLCGLVDAASPDVAYELGGFAVDHFDRLGNVPTLVLPPDERTRPPTVTNLTGVSPRAEVTAWTTSEGSIVFRARQIGDGPGSEADFNCSTAREIDDEGIWSGSLLPYPNIYDANFDKTVRTSVPFEVGGRLLVCVEVYDTANVVRPLAIERHLFEAPLQGEPQVVLRSIDTRGEGSEIDELTIKTGGAAFGPVTPDCDRLTTVGSIGDDQLATFNDLVWGGCAMPMMGNRGTGQFALPLQILRGGSLVAGGAIPIDTRDCSTAPCPQRTQFVRVPIVAPRQGVCANALESGCAPDTRIDGVATFAIEYPVARGAGFDGRVTALDEVDLSTRSEQPIFSRPAITFRAGDGPLTRDATIVVQSDRPVRLGIEAREIPVGPSCAAPLPSPMTDDFLTEFSIPMSDFCVEWIFALVLHAIDEEGGEWAIEPRAGFTAPSAPSFPFSVDIDLRQSTGGPSTILLPGYPLELNGRHEGGPIVGQCRPVAPDYFSTQSRFEVGPAGLGVRASMTVRPVAEGDDCSDTIEEQQRYGACLDFWARWRAAGSPVQTGGQARGQPLFEGGDPDDCVGNPPAPPERWTFSVVFAAADAVALGVGDSLEIDVRVRDGVTATVRITGRSSR